MHWLIKSEPDVFSIHDLETVPQEPWSGVRNYQARNFMWRDMKPGELALFYHSNAKPPGIAGVAKVASASYPDPTQYDSTSEYFDPKATEEKPRWYLVDFEHVATFDELMSLDSIKSDPILSGMMVCQKGTRLSINPVEPEHFQRVLKLAGVKFSLPSEHREK
jgi:predicted RNA-binding protein with PUA-like domain